MQLQATAKGTANVLVRDIAGRVLSSKNIAVEKGGNYLSLTELKTAQPGAYFIEITCGEERNFVKVLKQ